MRIKNFIIAALLAGATLIPATMSFGADRTIGSYEMTQFVKTKNLTGPSGDVRMTGKTPSLIVGDKAAEDTSIVFDGNAQDFYIGLDDTADDLIIGSGSAVGTTPAISIDENQIVTITNTMVNTAGQTRKKSYNPAEIDLDDSNPPTKNTTEGGTGNVWECLQFDADGGTTGDDLCYIKWHVPDGYVTDSARLNVVWSCESAETSGDTLTIDGAVLSVSSGGSVDAATTGMTAVVDTQWTGSADLVFTTQLSIEVTTVAVDDLVYITFFVDETASAFADTIDVHKLEIEWESTE